MLIITSQSLEIYHQLDLSTPCFVAYLKQQNSSDDYLKSLAIKSQKDISDACENGAYIQKETLLGQALLTLRFKDNYECRRIGLEHSINFKNLLLSAHVVRSMSDIMEKLNSLVTGNKTPKEIAAERIETQLRDILSTIEVKCALSVDFGNLFDSFFTQSREDFSPYEDVQEYCIRKELEDKQVIILAQFRTTINPKNLKLDQVDCNKIIEPLKSQTFETSKGDFDMNEMLRRPCVIAVLNEDNDYFYLLLKAELISKFNLPRDQKLAEREKFIDKMIEITTRVRERC